MLLLFDRRKQSCMASCSSSVFSSSSWSPSLLCSIPPTSTAVARPHTSLSNCSLSRSARVLLCISIPAFDTLASDCEIVQLVCIVIPPSAHEGRALQPELNPLLSLQPLTRFQWQPHRRMKVREPAISDYSTLTNLLRTSTVDPTCTRLRVFSLFPTRSRVDPTRILHDLHSPQTT